MRGEIYLYSREQVYSSKLEKICTINKVSHLMNVKEYNKLYPDKKKNPNKYDFVKVPVTESFREIDILLCLAEIYKAGGSSG